MEFKGFQTKAIESVKEGKDVFVCVPVIVVPQ